MLESMKAKVERIRERIRRKEELIAKAKEGTKAKARYEEDLTRIIRELESAQSALESAQHADRTVTTDTHCTGSTTGKTCTVTTGKHTTGSTTGNTGTVAIDIQTTASTTGSQGTAGEVDTPRTRGKVGTPRAAGKEGTPGPGQEGIMLSPAQAEAYGRVQAAFEKGKPALLHGVTGSGKTVQSLRRQTDDIPFDTGRRTGMTIIIITHNAALTAMADRVIRVHSGTVASVTVNEHPQDISEIEW